MITARRLAAQRHVLVAGTVGVLVRAVHRSYLARDEANMLLGALIAAGYFSPVDDIDQALEGAGETTP